MVELLTIDGEEFEIMCITPDLYEESEELFMYVFPNFGNMCLCTNLKEAPEAMEELRKLMLAVLNDGISFAARHRATDQLVGICCNKIINNKKNITLDEALKNLKSPEMLAIDAYFELLENGYDIFKEWQVESAFEIEFLAVHPAWGKRGLGFSILSHALDFAHAMAKGELRPDQMAHVSKQIREEQPQVAMGLFTSFYTQKMVAKLNFVSINVVPISEISFENNTFTQFIDSQHVNSQFAAKRL
ncbi:uncharacterized protein LOC115624186 isoform X1 [Scaptodrosophila lebanonensis]|uniref:Uncharacterized protein LOC115624186 isoform X1 n=1 Tax=Drosophila lebanonensis TaxID=7225 RepID=A0A6J2THZ4_DROLE|nr:uncharacterized protein LOC115624186 isoform X1 [Scaptodrosophila lebanonensis]